MIAKEGYQSYREYNDAEIKKGSPDWGTATCDSAWQQEKFTLTRLFPLWTPIAKT